MGDGRGSAHIPRNSKGGLVYYEIKRRSLVPVGLFVSSTYEFSIDTSIFFLTMPNFHRSPLDLVNLSIGMSLQLSHSRPISGVGSHGQENLFSGHDEVALRDSAHESRGQILRSVSRGWK